MLIALLLGTLAAVLGGGHAAGLWFFGGQTLHQLKKQVAKIEPDKASCKPIDNTLDQIEAKSKRLLSEGKKLGKDVFAALERHDTPAEEFRTFGVQSDELTASLGKDLLDLRFALRSQLTDEQWRRLFPTPTASPSQ